MVSFFCWSVRVFAVYRKISKRSRSIHGSYPIFISKHCSALRKWAICNRARSVAGAARWKDKRWRKKKNNNKRKLGHRCFQLEFNVVTVGYRRISKVTRILCSRTRTGWQYVNASGSQVANNKLTFHNVLRRMKKKLTFFCAHFFGW